jgi:hypothetical protein
MVSYSIPPSIMGTPFHQHLFDFTPLLEQELVCDLVGVIRECGRFGFRRVVRGGATTIIDYRGKLV